MLTIGIVWSPQVAPRAYGPLTNSSPNLEDSSWQEKRKPLFIYPLRPALFCLVAKKLPSFRPPPKNPRHPARRSLSQSSSNARTHSRSPTALAKSVSPMPSTASGTEPTLTPSSSSARSPKSSASPSRPTPQAPSAALSNSPAPSPPCRRPSASPSFTRPTRAPPTASAKAASLCPANSSAPSRPFSVSTTARRRTLPFVSSAKPATSAQEQPRAAASHNPTPAAQTPLTPHRRSQRSTSSPPTHRPPVK